MKIGQPVLVKTLSLAYSDYKNLTGEVVEIRKDCVVVAIPKNKISAEDARELRKAGENVLAKVKESCLS